MNHAMTIEAFHALLTSKPEEKERPLLAALRQLMAIEEPEKLAALADEPLDVWAPWREV